MAIFLFLRPFVLLSILFGLFFAINKNGIIPAVNAGANVEIQGPSIRISPPQSLKISITNLNEPHYLPCSVRLASNVKSSKINYSWYHNENKLKVGKRSNDFEIYKNGTLRIPPKIKSKGVYRCQINGTTNIDSVVIRSTNIYVDYAVLRRLSEWNNGNQIQSDLKAVSGSFITLNCPIESVPQANITWSFENVIIYDKFHKESFIILNNGSLIIKNINDNHKGKYKCQAENIYANKTHRHFLWNLSVIPSSKRTNSELGKLLPPLQNDVIYISPGKILQLMCDGNSETIRWSFKNDTILQAIRENTKILIIKQVSIINDGIYICSTPTDSQSFQVIVTIPPNIVSPLKSFESSLSATITISCNATGRPAPEIIWYRNGARLYNSYTVQYRNNPAQLKLMSFDKADVGTYQCFAKNVAGEVYSSGQLNLRSSFEFQRPENLQCYPVNYKTVKISFSSGPLTYMSVNIVEEDPYDWKSIVPMHLTSVSEITISENLPILQPFVVLLRGLYQTSVKRGKKGIEETVESSLLSDPVRCATQGLPVHANKISNGIYLWWSRPNITEIEYFVIQFMYSSEIKLPLFKGTIFGTTSYVPLKTNSQDNQLNFVPISIMEDSEILNNWDTDFNTTYNDYFDAEHTENYILILPANTTGLLISKNFKINVRVLLITKNNLKLKQNLKFLEWKYIDTTTVVTNDPWQIIETDGRNIRFSSEKINKNCIKACIKNILEFHILQNNQDICFNIPVKDNSFWIRGAFKSLSKYRITFYDCETNELWGDTDIVTKADPPGPISNQNLIWENGLKLSWNPPINPNGLIYSYIIKWTLNTTTFEANVTNRTWFIFPNVTEDEKIRITIYVVGESGIGSPIYIDVKNNVNKGKKTQNSSIKETYWPAIFGGSVLSVGCIIVFILLFLCQRRRFKQESAQNQCDNFNANPEAYTTNTPTTRNDLQNLGPDCRIHEYYEMETLIPQTLFSNMKSQSNGKNRREASSINSNIEKRLGNNERVSNNDVDFNINATNNCTSTPLLQNRKDLNKTLPVNDGTIAYDLSPINKVIKKYNRKSYEPPIKISPTPNDIIINKINSSPNFFGNNSVEENSYNNYLNNIHKKDKLENNSIIKETIKTNSNANLPPLKHSLSTLVLSTLPQETNNDYDNDDNHLQNPSTSVKDRNMPFLTTINLNCNKYNKFKTNNTNNNNTYEFNNSILNTSSKPTIDLDSSDLTTTTLLDITTLDDKNCSIPNNICLNNIVTDNCPSNNTELIKTNSIGNKTNCGCRSFLDPNG